MIDEALAPKVETATLEQKTREWVASESGRQAIEQVVQETERAQRQLMEARRVDAETLKKPVNL